VEESEPKKKFLELVGFASFLKSFGFLSQKNAEEVVPDPSWRFVGELDSFLKERNGEDVAWCCCKP
jgi:hypothetical protein